MDSETYKSSLRLAFAIGDWLLNFQNAEPGTVCRTYQETHHVTASSKPSYDYVVHFGWSLLLPADLFEMVQVFGYMPGHCSVSPNDTVACLCPDSAELRCCRFCDVACHWEVAPFCFCDARVMVSVLAVWSAFMIAPRVPLWGNASPTRRMLLITYYERGIF